MAWTTPKTNWVTGNVVGATEMNNIGNNLLALYTGALVQARYKPGAAITTNSVTFVDMDATNLSWNITIAKTRLVAMFTGYFGSSVGTSSYWDLTCDGVRASGDVNGIMNTQVASTACQRTIWGIWTSLTPGAKVVRLQARHATGGANVAAVHTETTQILLWEL